jgi:hypothetical protein
MNVKFAILSTIAIIAASSTVQSAEAQGARFHFQPNVWKNEAAKLPPGYGEPAPNPHSVRHGSVPKASSMLGIDPTMLAPRPQQVARGPRVAPIAQTQLSGIPSFTSVVPMLNPFAPVANKGQFGQPLSSSPVVASLPPQARPQVAQAKPPAPASVNSNVQGTIKSRRSTNNLRGRMVPPARALAAKQGSPIQSYGSNFGYTPGSTVPTGSGFSTHTSVNGVVLYKSTKH